LDPAIRRYRKAAGLTQAELGERTGFDPKTISRFETGTYTPSVDVVRTTGRPPFYAWSVNRRREKTAMDKIHGSAMKSVFNR
jgi:DNA-binding XRE family transcriptional regulator